MCRSLKIQGAFKFLVELTQMWTWKSRIVAIFLLFLTLWRVLTYKQADATLASLSILKYEALKWPHRVIRGSKIKSGWILFKSMSDRRPWLKNSKNVIIFQMWHVVLTLGVVKGQRLVFRLYRVKKLSCSDFPENGGILFFYLLEFRKRIVCTIPPISPSYVFRSKCHRSPFSQWQ